MQIEPEGVQLRDSNPGTFVSKLVHFYNLTYWSLMQFYEVKEKDYDDH